MTLISTVTVGSGGAASLDFTSIPQTATDLVLVMSLRDNRTDTASPVGLKINGVTTNRTVRILQSANGGGAFTESATYEWVGFGAGGNTTSNTFGNGIVYIPNYAGSTNKSISADWGTENNSSATAALDGIFAGLWSSTAAITSLTITCPLATLFSQYSTASLYSVTKGSGGATVS